MASYISHDGVVSGIMHVRASHVWCCGSASCVWWHHACLMASDVGWHHACGVICVGCVIHQAPRVAVSDLSGSVMHELWVFLSTLHCVTSLGCASFVRASPVCGTVPVGCCPVCTMCGSSFLSHPRWHVSHACSAQLRGTGSHCHTHGGAGVHPMADRWDTCVTCPGCAPWGLLCGMLLLWGVLHMVGGHFLAEVA